MAQHHLVRLLAWHPLVLTLAVVVSLRPSVAQALEETHTNLQSVTATGTSAWLGSFPFTLRGVILNNPEERLDATPDFLPWNSGANVFRMGGEWEIFIQSVDPLDRGGTACWMGQNYGNLPWIANEEFSYTNEAWLAELDRLNQDPGSQYLFRKGDLVEVTANRSLFYAGKRNINEAHDIDPAADFTIVLLQTGHGLPEPETIKLADVVNSDDGDPLTHEDIFDQTRATGGERYQGMRTRINALRLVDSSGWGQTEWDQRKCTVRDGTGRLFTLRMPLTDLGPAPDTNTLFNVTGIMDQDSGSSNDGTHGYNLLVQEVTLGLHLEIVDAGDHLELRWPTPSSDFTLERTEDPAGPTWMVVTNAATNMPGGITAVNVDKADAGMFYRLRGQ